MLFQNLWFSFLDFLDLGGAPLKLLFIAMVLFWSLILERFYFMRVRYEKLKERILEDWCSVKSYSMWEKQKIKDCLVSEGKLQLDSGLFIIKTLVTICPLLGLLGTVSGMIEIFEMMALQGSTNAKMMASGIAKATITTMAGMVGAISSIYFNFVLQSKIRKRVQLLHDNLKI